MLAISLTAIDVAFVGALAALMAAIAAPLTSWVITRAGQRHDRLMAQDERNYTTCSAVYVDVLKDIHADLTSITEVVRLFDEPSSTTGIAPDRVDSRTHDTGTESIAATSSAVRRRSFTSATRK